uniref:Uncharacterized protein n=1 Tax=Octopus bimaculoides TaxID=37653 RepID=A0A0L8FLK2_OCTBM
MEHQVVTRTKHAKNISSSRLQRSTVSSPTELPILHRVCQCRSAPALVRNLGKCVSGLFGDCVEGPHFKSGLQ